MANWISSKLKVAETFFEQIDQQAADSLKKERALGSEDQNLNLPTKGSGNGGGGTLPLKDQLKKKTSLESNGHEYIGKLKTDPNINSLNNPTNIRINGSEGDKGVTNVPNSSSKPKPTLSENDWTELLSAPIQATPSSSRSNGASSVIREVRKDGRKLGISRSNLSVQERKKNMSSGGVKSKKALDIPLDNKLNGKRSDEDGSSSSATSSSVELQGDGKVLGREEVNNKDVDSSKMEKQSNNENESNGGLFESKHVPEEDHRGMGNNSHSLEMSSVSEKIDRVSDGKKGVRDAYDRLRSTVKGKRESAYGLRNSVSDDTKKGFSTSDEGSDSDSDSVSTSDSENEQDRERREQILAEKAAARAVEAIKERENMVARLEGEKQSLEKILEERAKQQAQEASELQTTMMETMDAVEMEKQKHKNTRMEALTRMATLEIANADLARSLATAQKNLEVESNRVAELRQQFELKEVAHEELRRKIIKTDHEGTYIKQAVAGKGADFEREILEAEYSFMTDKIGKLEDKAKELEEYIEMTRKDMEDPTEVEIELKRRLAQLTDHLIQKQAQVEVLSSEKATLFLRIETVSRSLEENNANSEDPESGAWESSDSKLRPLFEEKFRSGRKHLGSLVRQLDAIFIAGAVFVRRNPAAKLWSLIYLVCLHFWVIYIFMSNSQVSDEAKSGAIISLANINNSSGV
ncbi:golgin candidate 2 [Euphorbia lathyris]|uniref:golgin candidate 2 n=1 Tax=Euphorbia lathyris TaxID=212925 RepID=UPI003313B028